METFSDGVLAIVTTIMVLELKVPLGDDWSALTRMIPVFGSYAMSFVCIGTTTISYCMCPLMRFELR